MGSHGMLDTDLRVPTSFPLSRNDSSTGEQPRPHRPLHEGRVQKHPPALPRHAGPCILQSPLPLHCPEAPSGSNVRKVQTSRPRAASWEGLARGCFELRGGGARQASQEKVVEGGGGGGASRKHCESEWQVELAGVEFRGGSACDPTAGGGGSAAQGTSVGANKQRMGSQAVGLVPPPGPGGRIGLGSTATPPPVFRCHATASTSRPSLSTSGSARRVMRYWDGSCASGDSDCSHVHARDHGRGEEPTARTAAGPDFRPESSEAGGGARRCRWAGLSGSGVVV